MPISSYQFVSDCVFCDLSIAIYKTYKNTILRRKDKVSSETGVPLYDRLSSLLIILRLSEVIASHLPHRSQICALFP